MAVLFVCFKTVIIAVTVHHLEHTFIFFRNNSISLRLEPTEKDNLFRSFILTYHLWQPLI